jgi:hypothetical protein
VCVLTTDGTLPDTVSFAGFTATVLAVDRAGVQVRLGRV